VDRRIGGEVVIRKGPLYSRLNACFCHTFALNQEKKEEKGKTNGPKNQWGERIREKGGAFEF